MTGQWEKYVSAGAEAVDPAAFDRTIENHDGYVRQFRRDKASGQARAVLAVVGPLIAEDARVRMVEAAGRAVERDTAPPFYYCPTSGEIEQTYEGGFTICCEAPLCHEPISPAAVAAAKRVPS
jgi:hypothetical protein